MSHDYDPCWDYPVIELGEVEDLMDEDRAAIYLILKRIQKDIGPALGFTGESAFEAFYVEHMGISNFSTDVVAVYCNGTSSRPIVGFDIQLIRETCNEEGLNWLKQFEMSLVHELGHAYQETLGFEHEHENGFDEDDAESFADDYFHKGEINIWILERTSEPIGSDVP